MKWSRAKPNDYRWGISCKCHNTKRGYTAYKATQRNGKDRHGAQLKIVTVPLRNYDIISAKFQDSNHNEVRFERILKSLILENTDSHANRKLFTILRKYQGVFHPGDEPLTTNNFY